MRTSAKTWTVEDNSLLLLGLTALVGTGMSLRSAVNFLADEKVFPHHERQPSQRQSGQATRVARRNALWRQFQRLLSQSKEEDDPLARALGIGASEAEDWLTQLDIRAAGLVTRKPSD
jgi:hypothetical protein